MELITAKNLTVAYDGNVILEQLNFSIERGDYLILIGENGCGKSTLISTLLGLKKPSCGAVVYGNGFGKNSIGYLAQTSGIQNDFPASVAEVVISGRQNRKFKLFYNESDYKAMDDALEKMKITHLKKKCFGELSGGQKQRVLLARAICAATELLIFDEPVTGLDPEATHDFYELSRDMHQSGFTVVTVTHDVRDGMKYANKVLHLGKRAVKFFGAKEDYLHTDAYRRIIQNVEGD